MWFTKARVGPICSGLWRVIVDKLMDNSDVVGEGGFRYKRGRAHMIGDRPPIFVTPGPPQLGLIVCA